MLHRLLQTFPLYPAYALVLMYTFHLLFACFIYSISMYSILYTLITQCPILPCILYLPLGYLSFALYIS